MKTALVTGADRGLGAALVAGLAARGWMVFAGYLRVPEASPAQASAEAVIPLALDVRSDASVAAAAGRAAALVPQIDLVINNAGILGDFTKGLADGLDFEDMKATYDVNALGPLRVSAAFYPLVAASGRGLIVNISSEAGSLHQTRLQDRRIRYGYCMSKSALNAATVILQNTARDDGVRVLLVEPGWIRSYMHGEKNLRAELEPEGSAEAILNTVLGPLADDRTFIDRFGNPYEF